jgi:soluble lytic murein transglycosylase
MLVLCAPGVGASPGDSDDDEEVTPVVAARPAAVARKAAPGTKAAKAVAFDRAWLQPFFGGPLLKKAAAQFRLEQWADAEAGFLKGAAKMPPKSDERHAARYMAGLAKANQGKWSDAAALFETLYRDYERLEPYVAYQAARCFLRAGQPQAALDWAAKVPNGSVPDADSDLVALDALRALSRWPAAAQAAADYLARRPSGARRAEVMFKRAEALEKLGGGAKPKPASACCAKGKVTPSDAETDGDESAVRPGSPEAAEIVSLYRRVWAEAPLDDWSERASDRLNALAASAGGGADAGALRTHDAASCFTRAMVYFDRNRNAESETAFASTLTAPGLDTDIECKARYHRAQSVWKQRDRKRAAPLFDDAEPVCARAKNADLHAKSLYQAARSWANAGNRAAAEARYARLEAEHPDHSYADDARVRTAELAADAGEVEGAEKILAEVPEKYPKGDLLSEALWRLAFSAWRTERHDEAIRWLDESLRRIPREEVWYAEGRALYWKARVLEKSKDAKEKKAARGYYQRAIREYPLSVYALLSFARIGDKDGKARDALVRELRDKNKPPPFHFQPRPLFGEAGFRRAVELARMGQGGDARRELNKLGLQTSGEKHGGDAKRDEEDVLWIAAVLLDRAGLWNAAHSIPRYTIKDYALAYPRALGGAKWRVAYPRAFPELVAKNAKANQIPEALQLAIMREESAFSPRIESFANAIGLTQMLQKTAKRFANGVTPTREQLMDPARNLEYGSRFLAFLWNHFNKAAPLAIAGYNAGEGAVDRWLSERGQLAMDEFMETIPYDETRNYTKRVLASFFAYSWLYDDKHPVPPIPLAARKK